MNNYRNNDNDNLPTKIKMFIGALNTVCAHLDKSFLLIYFSRESDILFKSYDGTYNWDLTPLFNEKVLHGNFHNLFNSKYYVKPFNGSIFEVLLKRAIRPLF